jgi:hypothetical protein
MFHPLIRTDCCERNKRTDTIGHQRKCLFSTVSVAPLNRLRIRVGIGKTGTCFGRQYCVDNNFYAFSFAVAR